MKRVALYLRVSTDVQTTANQRRELEAVAARSGWQVVEVFEFESEDPGLRGEMTMTTTLTDADGGTEVAIVHEQIPDSVPPADNETGTRMALENLARLVEAR